MFELPESNAAFPCAGSGRPRQSVHGALPGLLAHRSGRAERIKATTGATLRGSCLWPGTCSLTLRTTSGHQRLWRWQAATLRLSTSMAPRRRSKNNAFPMGLARLGGSEQAFHVGHHHPCRAWSSLSLQGFASVCGVGVPRAHGPQHPCDPRTRVLGWGQVAPLTGRAGSGPGH